MFCKIPGCNNLVASETLHNKRLSKNYCVDHAYGIIALCSECGTKMIYKPWDYIEILQTTNVFRFQKCFMKMHNSSALMKECSSKTGKKFGSINILKYNQSNLGRANSSYIAKEYGLPSIKEKWIGTNEHLNQIKLLGKHQGGHNIIFRRDNNCDIHHDEKLSYYGECWQCFKSKFENLNHNFNIPIEFKIISTFRTQNSENWIGARLAFEQSLIDDDIGWFVYIKFYIDKDESIKPLVVGKSGSLLVNYNGSDVSFSADISDGPARRFLQEEGLEWCKTQIAILKCSSEQEVYEKEKYYIQKMNLFGS